MIGEKLDVVLAPVGELHPHPRNPRTISAERLGELRQNLEAAASMLWARPLIALPDGTVIAGNQRLLVAQELEWPEVPVVFVDLDEDEALLWALRDNRGFGDDDEDATGALLAELESRNVPLVLTGFTRADLERFMFDVANVPPASEDEQGALDRLSPPDPVTCPHCGEQFVPGAAPAE